MKKADDVLATARLVAEAILAPAPVTELLIGSESIDPQGSTHWIVRAWDGEHRLLFVSVRLASDGTLRAEPLSPPSGVR